MNILVLSDRFENTQKLGNSHATWGLTARVLLYNQYQCHAVRLRGNARADVGKDGSECRAGLQDLPGAGLQPSQTVLRPLWGEPLPLATNPPKPP